MVIRPKFIVPNQTKTADAVFDILTNNDKVINLSSDVTFPDVTIKASFHAPYPLTYRLETER